MGNFWQLEKHGDLPAFVQDDGRSLSYNQAAFDADLLAQNFGGNKKLVFILCENNIESNIAYLACLRSGHTPLLLNAAINDELLRQLCVCYKPNFIWRKSNRPGIFTYGKYTLEAYEHCQDTPIYKDLALLLATSGSTGSQKLVRLSYDNIESNAAAIAEYLRLTSDERAITVLPMNYTYGLSVINSHLKAGARILLTNSTVIQREFWSFFREQGSTSLVGVPYTYDMYLRMGLMRMNLPTLRNMTQAGGKLNPDKVLLFANWAKSCGIKFFVMYGQTEATARMSYLPPDKVLEKSSSVGIAIPGGRFSILDHGDSEINESGIDGELVYQGSNVSLGYAESRVDLFKGDENRGLLKTGDIAQYDEDRYVYITGRLKRFIKIAGNRVGLDDLEKLFRDNGIEAFCGGRDSMLCIAVLQHEEGECVKQFIESKFQFHHSMYRVIKVSEIPRNDSGKVQYSLLFKEILDA